MNYPSYLENRQKLQNLMEQVGIASLKELSHLSGISQWQLIRIEYGLILKIPVENLLKLAQTLQISLNALLDEFTPQDRMIPMPLPSSGESGEALERLRRDYQRRQQEIEQQRDTLQQERQRLEAEIQQQQETFREELQRLQKQMEQQKQTVAQEFQKASLHTLESWLLQWPTAAVMAQKNPQLSATKLLPLLKPMAVLLQQWGVEAIASVGERVPYDPQLHQLMEGEAQPGDFVRVRYVGYRQGDKLLYRARVSPIPIQTSSAKGEDSGPLDKEKGDQTSPTTVLDLPDDSPTTVLDI